MTHDARNEAEHNGSLNPSYDASAHPDSAPRQGSPQGNQAPVGDGATSAAPNRGVADAVGNALSFMLHSKDKRAEYLAKKASAASASSASPAPRPVGADGAPMAHHRGAGPAVKATRVSRRARILGGNRTRAVIFQGAFAANIVLTLILLGLVLGDRAQPDVDTAVAEALREQGQEFPEGQAVAWASNVAIDWGTWDTENTDERKVRMAQYLTSGMDEQAGWNGQGTQEVTFVSANPQPTVIDENHAIVNVDYRLSDDSRRCLSVPVYAYQPEGLTGASPQWAFALSGNPIPRPCAPRTGAVSDNSTPESEDGSKLIANGELSQELTTSFFPSFFAAWAASDDASLRQFTASGVTTIGLGGAMTSSPAPSIKDVEVFTPQSGDPVEGTVYHAIVPVTWTVAGSDAQVTATYDVPMKMVGDRWYVAGEPSPAANTAETGSGSPAPLVDPDENAAPGASDGGEG